MPEDVPVFGGHQNKKRDVPGLPAFFRSDLR